MTETLEPTAEEIDSACLSYRHDFGLLPKKLQDEIRYHAREWLRAWQKEPVWSRRAPVTVSDAEIENAARAICLSDAGDSDLRLVPDELMPGAWKRGKDIYMRHASAALRALAGGNG